LEGKPKTKRRRVSEVSVELETCTSDDHKMEIVVDSRDEATLAHIDVGDVLEAKNEIRLNCTDRRGYTIPWLSGESCTVTRIDNDEVYFYIVSQKAEFPFSRKEVEMHFKNLTCKKSKDSADTWVQQFPSDSEKERKRVSEVRKSMNTEHIN